MAMIARVWHLQPLLKKDRFHRSRELAKKTRFLFRKEVVFRKARYYTVTEK